MMDKTTSPSMKDHKSIINDVLNYEYIFALTNRIAGQAYVADHIKDKYILARDSILKRIEDSQLYLAVLGEFSSGKSTFINALIKQDLLKTSNLVSTITATKIKYDGLPRIEIVFDLDKKVLFRIDIQTKQVTVYDSTSEGKLEKIDGGIKGRTWRRINGNKLMEDPQRILELIQKSFNSSTLSHLTGIEINDYRWFLQALTSQETFTDHITEILVYYPSSFLKNNIVLIDTPGMNSTIPAHKQTTVNIVKNVSDIAIILIPANQPLSNTLIEFIRKHLDQFIHRCVFLITRMDTIKRKTDQEKLYEHVINQIKEKLGIEKPVVFITAAQIMIDHITKEYDIPERLKVWIEQFEELEEGLINKLQKERILSVLEKSTSLLSDLSKNLEDHLDAQWEKFKSKKQQIQENLIPDLEDFISKHDDLSKKVIHSTYLDSIENVEEVILKNKNEVINTFQRDLFSKENVKELDRFVRSGAREIIDISQIKIDEAIQKEVDLILDAGTNSISSLEQEFSEIYQRLEILDSSAVSDYFSGKMEFDKSKVTLKETRQKENSIILKERVVKLGGLGTGACLGCVLLPGCGPLIGGIIGSKLGGKLADPLEKRKGKLWEELNPALQNAFDEIILNARNYCDIGKEQTMDFVYKQIEKYKKSYNEIVKQMIKNQEEEYKILKDYEVKIENDKDRLKELNNYLAEVYSTLSRESLISPQLINSIKDKQIFL